MSTKKLTLVMAGLALMPSATFISSEIIDDAIASTSNENIGVTATVNTNCRFTNSAATVAFGTYDPVVTHASTPLDASATVEIKCTKGGVATLTLNNGLNGSGSAASTLRNMKDGSNSLPYNIYTTVGRTVIWSSGGGGANEQVYTSTAANTKTPFVLYGRIEQALEVVAGTGYTDTVQLTATY